MEAEGERMDGWVDSDDDVLAFLFLFCFFGCLWKGMPVLDGLERGRQRSGSEPDKGIIEPWRLG